MVLVKRLAGAVLVAGCVAVLPAPLVEAAERVPFLIVETDILPQLDLPPTFESSDPLCPSGSVTDEYRGVGRDFNPAGKNVLTFRTEYVCANGTGSFYVVKHVVSGETIGRARLQGGTGLYSKLRGLGTFTYYQEDVGGAPATITRVSGVVVGQ